MLFDKQPLEQNAHLFLSGTLAYDFVSKNIAPSAHVNDAATLSSVMNRIHIPVYSNTIISRYSVTNNKYGRPIMGRPYLLF